MIRVSLRRTGTDGKPEHTRGYFDDPLSAMQMLVAQAAFVDAAVTEIVIQRLPDGPDVWPLPGYDEGMAHGEGSTLDFYSRNPGELPISPEANTGGEWRFHPIEAHTGTHTEVSA